MVFNKIREYYYNELFFNKKKYYFFLLLTSILLMFFSAMHAFFDSMFFCWILIYFNVPKCNNDISSKNLTNSEIKMVFLIHASYSFIIFAMPQILINILKFRGSYTFDNISTFLVYYFMTSIFYFMINIIFLSFMEYEKNHIILKIIFSVLLISIYISPIALDFIDRSSIKYFSNTRILISRFIPQNLYLNEINTINTNCVKNDPLTINLSFVPRYGQLQYCGFMKVDYSMEILNIYLLIISIFILIFFFYFFDSITIENFLRTLPLFKFEKIT